MGISKERTFQCEGCGKTVTGPALVSRKYCSHPCYVQKGQRKYVNKAEWREAYKRSSVNRRRRTITRAIEHNAILVKACVTCGQTQHMKSFQYNRPDGSGWNSQCVTCGRKMAKEIAFNKRAWLKQYKESVFCVACSESRSACLDFHHVVPKTKKFAMGTAAGTVSLVNLKKEIKKCICVCRNCHALIHSGDISLADIVQAITQEVA